MTSSLEIILKDVRMLERQLQQLRDWSTPEQWEHVIGAIQCVQNADCCLLRALLASQKKEDSPALLPMREPIKPDKEKRK